MILSNWLNNDSDSLIQCAASDTYCIKNIVFE